MPADWPESAKTVFHHFLAAEAAAPLLCAGITTFNALRNQDLQPGDLVAVQGIGGLGHLGVQYAAAMGLEEARFRAVLTMDHG